MIISGLEDDEKIKSIKDLIETLQKPSVEILSYLLFFLSRVAQQSQFNKMGSPNLGIVFAPLILYPRDKSFNEYIFRSSVSSKGPELLRFMIDNVEKIFATQPIVQRSSSLGERTISFVKQDSIPTTLTVSIANWSPNSPLHRRKKLGLRKKEDSKKKL